MADVGNAQREIRRIAYALWMEEGQPEGRDREHWETAKEIWSFRHRESAATEQAGQQAGSAGGDRAGGKSAPDKSAPDKRAPDKSAPDKSAPVKSASERRRAHS